MVIIHWTWAGLKTELVNWEKADNYAEGMDSYMRFGVFYDREMPFLGARPDEMALEKVKEYADIINLDNYREMLANEYDCLVNMHGSCFIKPAWSSIIQHLKMGKGLVNIGGGTPFSIPVSAHIKATSNQHWQEGIKALTSPSGESNSFINDKWVLESTQTVYHEELYVRQGMAIKKDRIEKLSINPDIPILEGYRDCFTIEDTLGFIVQFTRQGDIPGQAEGPMDAVMHPLLVGYSDKGRKTAAPVVMIENTKGVFEGGRWIFINQMINQVFWENKGPQLIFDLAQYAGKKAYEIIVRPAYASYNPGEQPALLLQWQDFSVNNKKMKINIQVKKDEETFEYIDFDTILSKEITYRSSSLNFAVTKGIYTVITTIQVEGESQRVYRNGFWGYDSELMEGGGNITCGRDYFYKDEKPMPVVGMTYMHPEVHRRFYRLPNVYLWDMDFMELKSGGVNMVRSGFWRGQKEIMPDDGIASEEILRALDGFLLTAKKYDMPVIFTLFAFTPERWAGVNPYLDPRSIRAQKRFVGSIAGRYRNCSNVTWDLINEPALCSSMTNWRPVPNYDAYEVSEWRKWLQERHINIESLQERWNCSSEEIPSFDSVHLPEGKDFYDDTDNAEPFKPLKMHDYILFTQDIMNRWAMQMTETIRSTGSGQLVTIGQDEGLHSRRPSPLFYQESVDYTTCHSWWLMDDLYWDGIFSKTPDKPNLIQETGIMYVQNADGKARRTESELRDILERKFAFAFGSNNAGVIHWIWNINVQLNSLNEANIGAVRADGSQKLEADVTYDFGEFIGSISSLFEERKTEDVAVIFPYANNFSVRDHALPATKRLARVLGYNLNIPFKVYGEYHLDELGIDKLIILPSARTLTQKAWDIIIDRVNRGSVLLITGPFGYDEYWRRINSRSEELQLSTVLMNTSREEVLYIDSKPYRTSFGGKKIAWVDKEVQLHDKKAELKTFAMGKGKIIWSPLPIEVNDEDAVIEAVYKYALKEADIKFPFEWIKGNNIGIFAKKISFKDGCLYIFISEYCEDMDIAIKDIELNRIYRFELPLGRVVLFATEKTGRIIKTYRNMTIKTGG